MTTGRREWVKYFDQVGAAATDERRCAGEASFAVVAEAVPQNEVGKPIETEAIEIMVDEMSTVPSEAPQAGSAPGSPKRSVSSTRSSAAE